MPAHAPSKRYKVPISLWLVENNQQFMDIGKMAEQTLDCKSKDRGWTPLFTKSCGVTHI